MPPTARAAIVGRLIGIVAGKSPTGVPPTIREITSAAKVLFSADRLNMAEQLAADPTATDMTPLEPHVAAEMIRAGLEAAAKNATLASTPGGPGEPHP